MKIFVLFFFLSVSNVSLAQQTYIPDDNFEQALIDFGYDILPLDDSVPTANIIGITYLDISWLEINDLTGIEDFISLSHLSCEGNNLAILDLSNNTVLSFLICHSNILTNLDLSPNSNLNYLDCSFCFISNLNISTNSALTYLNCGVNNLTSLDISSSSDLSVLICNLNKLTSLDLSKNTALTELDCPLNEFTTLDLSANTDLSYIRCNGNNISSLNLSTNINLSYLYCRVNQLESLDLSSNLNLLELDCDNNPISSLELSENIALEKLVCYNNELIDLNLSANANLTYIRCSENQLENLDIRNGKNAKITHFDATTNVDLNCIYVDSKSETYLTDWLIDTSSTFVETEEECEALNVDFWLSNSELLIYPNPSKGIFKLENKNQKINNIVITEMTGKQIVNLSFLKNIEQIDLSGFRNGIYIIRIQTGKEILTQKIIKK